MMTSTQLNWATEPARNFSPGARPENATCPHAAALDKLMVKSSAAVEKRRAARVWKPPGFIVPSMNRSRCERNTLSGSGRKFSSFELKLSIRAEMFDDVPSLARAPASGSSGFCSELVEALAVHDWHCLISSDSEPEGSSLLRAMGEPAKWQLGGSRD